MTKSMTAFARAFIQKDWGQLVWEIKAVNHRFLDVTFKMPENIKEWEIDFRHLVSKWVRRGKVECHLTFFPSSQTSATFNINTHLVEKLVSSAQIVMQHACVNDKINPIDVLHWPEVIRIERADLSSLKQSFVELFEQTLTQLNEMRVREGVALRTFIQEKLNQMNEQIEGVKANLPEAMTMHKQKIMQKCAELSVSLDPGRLEQEYVFYAQKIDVLEEVERLATHIKEVARILCLEEANGRRLDFLMQEMGREANTLGAKAPNSRMINSAVELKVLIEQMREQIQNVE